jgi:uncharacterized coiled-coil protein SlyX
VREMFQTVNSYSQTIAKLEAQMGPHSQSIAKLEFQMKQLLHALNQIEEEELCDLSKDNSPHYMIDENASNSSHDELIQANIQLRRERIIDNEMEERNNNIMNP